MSQCDLIAAVLADREWHTVAEIHQRCGFSRLNSRVAELRSRKGMTIECRHVAGVARGSAAYEYRLVSLECAPVSASGAGALSSDPGSSTIYDPPGDGDTAAGAAHQLTVWDALVAA